jgi:hypothetical protein
MCVWVQRPEEFIPRSLAVEEAQDVYPGAEQDESRGWNFSYVVIV